jgi:hypothetical protein
MGKIVMRFGEVILKTARYDELKSWYCEVLDTQPMLETERTVEPGAGVRDSFASFGRFRTFLSS